MVDFVDIIVLMDVHIGTPEKKIVMDDSIAIGMVITIIHMRDKVVCLINNLVTMNNWHM